MNVPKVSKSHAAKLDKSERLQAVFNCLKSGQPKTTAEIQAVTGSTATHSDISELRQNGFTISCRFIGHTTLPKNISIPDDC